MSKNPAYTFIRALAAQGETEAGLRAQVAALEADLATRTQERDEAREALTALATAAGGAIESLQSAEETLSETGHELVRVMGDLRDRRVILKRLLARNGPPDAWPEPRGGEPDAPTE